jgi:transcriptional regulator with XRE-family HTH domain
MQANEVIRARREELGLRAAEVAMAAGIGDDAYRDIESYEDEAFTTAQLQEIRSIFETLGLDLLSVFGIECRFCTGQTTEIDLFDRPRNEVIAQRRSVLGLTREQLGDRIGFETVAIEEMEQDPAFLERWSIQLIEQLARELGLPVQPLLRVRCLRCGQGSGYPNKC